MFLIFQTGWREVHVTRRTKEDFARQMKWLVDEVSRRQRGFSGWTT
jgi:sporulation-control protein spo0M